ncbi:unnamed protein product [Polarella glacialis]|uniref:Photosystem II reaction center protein L n=1 Tax=Polarella glacialis TaxID=89957 RepID=A0A813DX83_POLGL|nr:unnamed protein product [Polarella glacialis]CAE8642893.1 unnamed protein product [Polarella glacialis]CAE8654949.1 unnamed protein product [Polarella glacialis]CAE8660911.1 unnamed protein product [Polarella glacialis]
MACRRPLLCSLAFVMAAVWLLAPAQEEVFVATPALRATSQKGTFAGATSEAAMPVPSALIMKGLPEPRPNDAMLPVELNRVSLYWSLLTILILSVLFSSYFFN